jgi:hypothetical protein
MPAYVNVKLHLHYIEGERIESLSALDCRSHHLSGSGLRHTVLGFCRGQEIEGGAKLFTSCPLLLHDSVFTLGAGHSVLVLARRSDPPGLAWDRSTRLAIQFSMENMDSRGDSGWVFRARARSRPALSVPAEAHRRLHAGV